MWNKQEDNRNTNDVHSLSWIERVFKARAESIHVTPRPGFKESLFLRLSTARQTKRMSPFFSGRPLFAGAGLAAFVAIVVLAVVFQPFIGVSPVYAQDQFTLVSEAEDPLGTQADATYLLESKTAIDVDAVKEMLSVNTSTPFALEQVNDKAVRVAFTEPLSEGKVLAFSLETTIATPNGTTPRHYGWAFQVKTPLVVTSAIPGDRTSGVPLDTGIEISFSQEIKGVEAFTQAFSIEPAVQGRFEVSPTNTKTFVFIPTERFQPGTLYTVTVQGNLEAKEGGDTLGEDAVIQFETSIEGASGEVNFWVPERYLTAVPGAEFALGYYDYDQSGAFSSQPYNIALYQIPSRDASMDVLKKAMNDDWRADGSVSSIVDPATLSLVSNFDAITRERSGAKQIVFPAPLAEGSYIAEISHAGYTRWAFIQSTPLVAYLAVDEAKTLVWVNSTETKGAVSGAQVSYIGRSEQASTDADGIAYVQTPVLEEGEDTTIIMNIQEGNHTLLVPSGVSYSGPLFVSGDALLRRGPGGQANQNYVGYLYTDRPTYQTDDTVQVWGVLKDRANGISPSELTVGFSSYGAEPIFAKHVTVSPTGVFTAELSLSRMTPGYYEVVAEVAGEIALRRGVSTAEYVKPAYALEMTLEKEAVFTGEPVTYTVKGTYFEGTPTKGLQVRVIPDYDAPEQILTLDDAGMATGSFSIPYGTDRYNAVQYYPRSVYPTVTPVRTEEGDILASTSLTVFGPNVWMEFEEEETKIENKVARVKVVARNVEAISSQDPKMFAPTLRAGQAFEATVTEISYNQRQVGTRYDYIRKVVTPLYEYDRVERELLSSSFTTDGSGASTFTFPAERADVNYEVRVKATAPNSYPVEASTFLWQRDEYDNPSQTIEFSPTKKGENEWTNPTYRAGEQVELKLKEGRKDFVMPEGVRALYFQAQNGIQEERVTNESTYSFPFETRDIPNVYVYGVLFAGDGYVFVQTSWWGNEGGYGVGYDIEEHRLNVAVTPSAEVTRPGEPLSVRVQVTDEDGNPVESDVNLNVVDEAYYALYPETVDPLPVLYHWLSSGVQAVLVSRESKDMATMAEGGGGGGDGGGRTDFKDTAAFISVRTNANGEADATFTLPDDITKWRVTAQAVDLATLSAGTAKTNVDASLPLFGLFVMRPTYLAADEPMILLRAAGTAIRPSDLVTYTIQIADADFEQTVEARAGESVRVTLPDLAVGTHDVTVDLKANGEEDRLTRKVNIVSARSRSPVFKTVSVADGTLIDGSPDGLTTVSFIDADRAEIYNELQELAWNYGDRADEGAVSLAATRLLNDRFGLEMDEPYFYARGYQETGVQLLPYSSLDLSLSARLAPFIDVGFDKNNLSGYFYAELDKTGEEERSRSEKFEAMAGLAALQEPILLELERAQKEKDLTSDEQLSLALGFHYLGDDESARTIYRTLVKTTKDQAGFMYLDGASVDERALRTARLAVLGAALNEPEHTSLYDYVTGIHAQGLLTLPEQFLYLESLLPYLGTDQASFRVTVNGESIEKTLEPWESYTLTLTPEARRNLNLQVTDGELSAVVSYDEPAPLERPANDSSMQITRVYSQADGSTRAFEEGDEVLVTLSYVVPPDDCVNNRDERDPNAYIPCQTYAISDVLPAGLVPVTPTQFFASYYGGGKWGECTAYSWGSWEGRSTFYVSTSNTIRCNNTINYRARVVTPGTYVAEPAAIRPVQNPSVVSYTNEQTFVATP